MPFEHRPNKNMDTSRYTTNDQILLDQFNDWRYGQYEFPGERNEVIRELNFHPHRRTCLQIWRKAEDFLKKAESVDARTFYRKLADKYRLKHIYAL